MEFEKLGAFYLGRPYDLSKKEPLEGLLLYDSKDLTTHAVCVGMTGSGKTGLCVNILEEAVMDNIPSIVIDPKGDLTNLLLQFSNLQAEDFIPWVNESDAQKKNLSIEEYAKQQAEMWKNGLALWGQDGNRIEKLKQNADYAIYTPGSQAGIPVSILKSFEAPNKVIIDDDELLRERINTTVTSLLGLIGIQADPIQSKEHILLSSILWNSWKENKNLDIASLITYIQTPEFTKVGVMDLDVFYPAQERITLSMKLNNLLAAPGFSTWLEGEALDIDKLLFTEKGKPRVSIFSIAHLNDSERMFFVSLLLNQIIGWMRMQSGTTSLRAIVYMDEIYGFFPPVANPPSKTPMLTLLKQARAYGVGMVLVTQNPVDLDYKGLANTGTWLIGRLQTDRDKARVLDGLEGAAVTSGSNFNRSKMEQLLAGLSNCVFLMHNIHEEEPVVFETRWAMSYLRGPLTRQQIKVLMDPYKASMPVSKTTNTTGMSTMTAAIGKQASQKPVLKNELPQWYIPLRSQPVAGQTLAYQPTVLIHGQIVFSEPKANIEQNKPISYLIPVKNDPLPIKWDNAMQSAVAIEDLEKAPADQAIFGELPSLFSQSGADNDLKKEALQWLYRSQQVTLWKSPSTKVISNPNEEERDFRIRMTQQVREQRDQALEDLRDKYAAKKASLEEKIRKSTQTLEREKEQVKQQGVQTAISVGATILGAILGRKTSGTGTVGRATTTARNASRTMKETQDVNRAKETVEVMTQKLKELEVEMQKDMELISSKMDASTEQLENVSIKPKKTDITVHLAALCWAPYWKSPDGTLNQAF
ncbi:MAG: DUF87 domain-containing protein [Caldisericia bacterium]|nr:DUF87 domain-containing protein [Caldisericia bacterium]